MQPDRTEIDPGVRNRVPVTVRDPGVPGPIPDRPAGGGWRLPAAFADRFRVVGEPMAGRGGEAVAVYRLRGGNVLKIYDPEARSVGEVWPTWSGIDSPHVVRLRDSGHLAGHAFEVIAYAGGRSLHDFIAEHPDGVGPEVARAIIAQLLAALEALGAARIVHRDLKPGNVLYDGNASGLPHLVLVDFGVSAYLGQPVVHTPGKGRTARYAAPEVLIGSASAKSDFWSLGMIAVELVTGRHPFADVADGTAKIQIVQNAVAVPEAMDPGLRRLCLGLLVGNHDLRWGAAEVARWLAGDDLPDDLPQRAPEADREPLRFAGVDYRVPAALATAMSEQWSLAASSFRPGTTGWAALTEWAAQFEEPGQPSFADRAGPGITDPSLPPAVALARTAALLDPALPPQYRGVSLAHADLGPLAQEAARGGPGDSQAILTDLWEHHLLADFEDAPGGRGLRDVERRWRASHERWALARRVMTERHPALERVLAAWEPGPQLLAWLLWAAADPAGSLAAIDDELAAAQREIRSRLGGGRLDWFDEIVAAAVDPTDRLAAHAVLPAARSEAEQLAADGEARQAGIRARRDAWRRREAWRRLDRPIALGWAAVAVATIMIGLVTMVMAADSVPFAGDRAVLTAWIVVIVASAWHAAIELWLAAEIGAPYHPGYSLLLDLGRRGGAVGRRFRRRGTAGLIMLVAVTAGLLAVLIWAPWLVPAVSVPVHLASAHRRYGAWQRDYRRRHADVAGGTDRVPGEDVRVPMGGNTP
jgi:hypothetical protein